MKPLTAEWVRKAEEDFAAAAQLQISNIVCYHCQQCAEKYLKARLQEAEIAFPKTHNLLELLGLVMAVEPLWESLREPLRTLARYASEFRYPGDDADATEAKRGMEMCRTIRQTVRRSLGLEHPLGGQQEFRVHEKPAAYRARKRKK